MAPEAVPDSANLLMTRRVVRSLSGLEDRLVLVGGCAVSVTVAEADYPGIRLTQDVDLVTMISSWGEWHSLESEIRRRGFRNGEVNCRFHSSGTGSVSDSVDIVPSDATVLGFTNRWFEHVLEDWAWHDLGEGVRIRVASTSTLIATKLEAWHSRGKGDYRSSHDLEDVVSLFDACPDLPAQVDRAAGPVRSWVVDELDALLGDAGFVDAISGHVLPDETSQKRVPEIIQRMRETSEL